MVDTDNLVSPLCRFAAELHAFERGLRSVYAVGGRLQTAAIEAQAGEGLSPVVGHQILSAIANAQLAISDALSRSAGGHKLIERLARELGHDVQAYGEGTKPPAPMVGPIAHGIDVAA